MLEGEPGTRKSTAMRPARNLLKGIDFNKLAPDRVSAERFIAEMEHLNTPEDIDGISFTTLNFEAASEIYVMAGEFQDFIGQANINFIALLTNLWDCLPEYRHPKLHGQSIRVSFPTVNILGGVNKQSLSICMPTEAIGQGGLSRWLFIHGDATGRKLTFPAPVNEKYQDKLLEQLNEIRGLSGKVTVSEDARQLLDRVYKEFIHLDDARLTYYNTRRFDFVLKLCVIFAGMDRTLSVNAKHVLFANTVLHYAEQRMINAFGEFGRAKNSGVMNQVVDVIRENLKRTLKPINIRDMYKQLSTSVNSWEDIIQIVRNLEMADKIQQKDIGGVKGYVPKHLVVNGWKPELLVPDFLRKDELT